MLAIRSAGTVPPVLTDVSFTFVFAGLLRPVSGSSGFNVSASSLPLSRYSREGVENRLTAALDRELGEGQVVGGERYYPRVAAVRLDVSPPEVAAAGSEIGRTTARLSFRYFPRSVGGMSPADVGVRVASAVASVLTPPEDSVLGTLPQAARTGQSSGQWRVVGLALTPTPAGAPDVPPPVLAPAPAPTPAGPASPVTPRVVPSTDRVSGAVPVLALLAAVAGVAALVVVSRDRAR